MSTNYHTPWADLITHFSAAEMNPPLAQLDQAITNVAEEVVAARGDKSSVNARIVSVEDGVRNVADEVVDARGSEATLAARLANIEGGEGFGSQSAGDVLAGPVSGQDAAPSFRPLVQSDLPVQPFDVHLYCPDKPGDAALLLRVPLARAVTFPANFAGSYADASVASTGSAVIDVQKNGISCGSITFAASAAGTFASAGGSAVSFAAGDALSIVGPATADATLADIGLVLTGTR